MSETRSFVPTKGVGMTVERQRALWDDAQAMSASCPPRFRAGSGYAIFASPASIEAQLATARQVETRISREIAWFEELRDLRASQVERGLWP